MNSFLDFLSLGAILSSVLVITSKNPVVAVIFLISLFINTAGYLIFLGIGFVGISYIIIYIGAITVLFLFVIMMVNIRLLDILEIGSEYTKNLPLAFIVGALFIYEIFSIIPFSLNDVTVLKLPVEFLTYINGLILNSNVDSFSLSVVSIDYNSPDLLIGDFTQIEVLGQGIYTYGALWLLISSLILLLAMVSAIFLSRDSSNYFYNILNKEKQELKFLPFKSFPNTNNYLFLDIFKYYLSQRCAALRTPARRQVLVFFFFCVISCFFLLSGDALSHQGACYSFLLGFFIPIFSDLLKLKFDLKMVINIILLILIIIYILQVFNINFELFPHVLLDEKNVNISVDGTKININALPEAATAIGNAAAFNAGIGAATALVKKTALPIGLKFGINFASGSGSLFTFNGTKVAANLLLGVEKNKIAYLSHIVSTENSSGAFEAKVTYLGDSIVKCSLEGGETINSLKELLSISLGLEVCIILLLIYSLIMLIFINIAKKEFALD